MSIKNKQTGQLEKKEVTIHHECLKQLEQLKSQAKAKQELKKAVEEETLYNTTANTSHSTGQKRSGLFDTPEDSCKGVKRQRLDKDVSI